MDIEEKDIDTRIKDLKKFINTLETTNSINKEVLLLNAKNRKKNLEKEKEKLDNEEKHSPEYLLGMKFGELTVISINRKQGKHWYYNCQCSCKNFCVVQKDHLVYGITKTCGRHNIVDIDSMIGNQYGNYKVLEFNHRDTNSNLFYKCLKVTNNKIYIVRRDNLLKHEIIN